MSVEEEEGSMFSGGCISGGGGWHIPGGLTLILTWLMAGGGLVQGGLSRVIVSWSLNHFSKAAKKQILQILPSDNPLCDEDFSLIRTLTVSDLTFSVKAPVVSKSRFNFAVFPAA